MSETEPRVLLECASDLPIVSLQVVLHPGSQADPPGLEGLTQMTSEMLRRGAAGRSRSEIDDQLDRLGAELAISAGPDSVSIVAHSLSRNVNALVDLLGDILGAPDFPVSEIEKLRSEMLAHLDELREDDRELCSHFFARHLYQEHPYGRPACGSHASLAAISDEDLRQCYRSHFLRSNLIMGLAGDIREPEATAIATQLASRLQVGKSPAHVKPDPPPQPRGRTVWLIDKPDRTQVQMLLGHPAPNWGTKEHDALQVLLTAFGGTFSSPLMQEIRVKRGLSYGAGASLHGGKMGAHTELCVFPAALDATATLELVLTLYETLAVDGLTEAELVFARQNLVGHFPLAVETPERRLGYKIDLALCGLPSDFVSRFPERISSVTLSDIRHALTQHVTPRNIAITMVAEAATLLPQLESAKTRLGLSDIRVVPYTMEN